MSDHVIEPMGGIIDAAVNAMLDAKIQPALFKGIIDAMLNELSACLSAIDPNLLSKALAANVRRAWGLSPLPMGHWVIEDVRPESSFILDRTTDDIPRRCKRRVRLAFSQQLRKERPWLNQGDCKELAAELTDEEIEKAIREVAPKEGIADIFAWLLENWKTWLPAVLSILLLFI